jgi:type II secretory pathway pseudopilin PulG
MERLKGRAHQARALEWGLVLVFIAVLTGVFISRYQDLEQRALARAARYEHQLLERQIQIYRIRHGHWPESLAQVLGEEPRETLIEGERFQRERPLTDSGRVRDPYGRPYRYHPDTGVLEAPTSPDGPAP